MNGLAIRLMAQVAPARPWGMFKCIGVVVVSLFLVQWWLTTRVIDTYSTEISSPPLSTSPGKSQIAPAKTHQPPALANLGFTWKPPLHPNVAGLVGLLKKKMLIMVITGPNNFAHRLAIRRTWGSVTTCYNVQIDVKFMVGRTTNSTVEAQLQSENQEFFDLIRLDMDESYRNLVFKTQASVMWAAENSDVDFLLKIDDDVFVQPWQLVRFLLKQTEANLGKFICGVFVSAGKTVERTGLKWAVSREELAQNKYPKYCEGFSYYIPMKQHRSVLRNAVRTTKTFPIEDAWISGIVAEHAHIDVFGPQKSCPVECPKVDDITILALMRWKSQPPHTFHTVGLKRFSFSFTAIFLPHITILRYFDVLWDVTMSHENLYALHSDDGFDPTAREVTDYIRQNFLPLKSGEY